ncbi:MAG: Fic family protein [Saprospiraceae bacterium]|nr:Fic family protein [Saprospiraceae bacterium]
MSAYIYNRKDWPNLFWDADNLLGLLSVVRNKQGILTGKMGSIGFNLQNEAYLETLSQDVIKSSEIEGEILDTGQVRSSVARKLGIDIGGLVESERHVDGVVEMMMNATQQWSDVLNEERLFGWHSALFPSGRSGLNKIIVGDWRDNSTGPMQVVSGPMGKETVHFQAPPAEKISNEMEKFFHWVNSENNIDPVLKAAISHLWFVTIHPFEDGNGRIARAITDMMLCRSEKKTQRFYSISSQINLQKKEYYEMLESAQKGSLDITDWLQWFLGCMEKAIDSSSEIVQKIISKHMFWNEHKASTFNKRQKKIIELLFGGFFGKLTTSKWAKINKCSQDSALRDIQDLMKKGVLKKSESGGRSTSYELIDPPSGS